VDAIAPTEIRLIFEYDIIINNRLSSCGLDGRPLAVPAVESRSRFCCGISCAIQQCLEADLDDADLDDANEDADLGFVNAFAEKIVGLEVGLDDTNDDAHVGLLRAAAFADNVGGLDDADEDADDDADDDADAGFENGAESDVRRVRRPVNFEVHDDVAARLVSAGPIETPARTKVPVLVLESRLVFETP
jgi:hypothetical protein